MSVHVCERVKWMGDLGVIHVYTLLRLSYWIYFYIDKREYVIEICDLLVWSVITICEE